MNQPPTVPGDAEDRRAARYWRIRTALELVKLAIWALLHIACESFRRI